METTTLGTTDLQVSRFCLGTMQFGWTADEATSFAVLDAYVAAGGTRQSDIIAKQQATRDEKRKVAEAKKKAEGDNAK